jgi:hypothetical protein
LNSARRCVIDVSDSEDDTSEDETPSTASVPRETLSSARDSALALELEIERMRKIIREREEMKLRKQVVGGTGSRCEKTHLGMSKMASSRSTPVSRESPAVSRHEGETAAPSSATRDEIPRSHNGNAKLSENVLATSSAPSEPHSDVNSPISSTPSPPGSPPLSPFQDTSNNAQVAVPAALTGLCPFLPPFQPLPFQLTDFVHRISLRILRHYMFFCHASSLPFPAFPIESICRSISHACRW